MKSYKYLSKKTSTWVTGLSGVLLTTSVFAADKLVNALDGDVQDTFGSSGTFWKIFIAVDIALSAAMAIKSKNPLVFAGVFFPALIPGFLLKAFVFG